MNQLLDHIIFDSSISFLERAGLVLDFQREHNPVYSSFLNTLGFRGEVSSHTPTDEIPLIPVRVFKEAAVKSFTGEEDLLFKSSGTGSMITSNHFVKERRLYEKAIEAEFYRHFPKKNTSIFCYTPGYSENPNSSLIWMLNHLIENDRTGISQFLPIGKPLPKGKIEECIEAERSMVLFGAAFGLLDLIKNGSEKLPDSSHIIETGGMKTHRREMDKFELRSMLSDGFGLPQEQIHSEYGMCELMSQCYAIGGEWFGSPEWVKVTIRDASNPLKICEKGQPGKIGIIDLANLYSCSFILTDDMGVMDEHGKFKVLGRWKNAEMRGCNFLIDNE